MVKRREARESCELLEWAVSGGGPEQRMQGTKMAIAEADVISDLIRVSFSVG